MEPGDDEMAQVLRMSKAEEKENNAQRKRKLKLLRLRMQRAGLRFIDKNESPSIRKYSNGGTISDGNCFWRGICQGRAGLRKVNGKRVSMQKRQDAQRSYMRLKGAVARHMNKNRTTGFNYSDWICDDLWDRIMLEVETDRWWHEDLTVRQATATYLRMTISTTQSIPASEDAITLLPKKTNGDNAKSRGTIYLADYAGIGPLRQGAHYIAMVPTTRAKKKQQSKKGKARAKPAEKKKAAAAKKVEKKKKAAKKKAAKKKAAAVKKAAAKKKKAAAVKKAAAKKKKEPAMAKNSMAKKRSMAKKSTANKK